MKTDSKNITSKKWMQAIWTWTDMYGGLEDVLSPDAQALSDCST